MTIFRVSNFLSQNTINSLVQPIPRSPFYALPFFFSLASNRRASVRTRPGTRKASRVPPHAYCRALLIGPDPGGMKYKNRNKAPLPVPGEMLRYRIRDSAGAPSRACKQTQNAPPPSRRPVLSALAACVSFFFPLPPLSNVAPRETRAELHRPPLQPPFPQRARTAQAVCDFPGRLEIPRLSTEKKGRRRSSTLSANLFLRDKLPSFFSFTTRLINNVIIRSACLNFRHADKIH